MNHYFDLRLRPDPELSRSAVMNALFARLHRALVALRSTAIGISFPEHDADAPHLGGCLRLHGVENALNALMATDWLRGALDHVELAPIRTAPADAQHRHVRRIQAKSSPERLRRRAMRRHGIDAETARQRIPDQVAESLRLPFVTLGSRSTGQTSFNLYIQHGPLQPEPSPGEFNSYGLTRTATIPWF